MTTDKLKGLKKVDSIYKDRGVVVRDLKKKGKKIMGYYCSHSPIEIITAMGYIPFRIQGSAYEPITKADSKISTMVCPILRSSLDLGLKGHYEFLSGFVATHSCDCEEKLARIWAQEVPVPFHYFLDLPHVIRPNSFEQFKDKLKSLQAALEEYTGMPLKADVLHEEILKHNQQRALVKALYELRKEDPPLLSGSEAMKITLTLMCLPIEEGSDLLKDIIEEVKMRKNGPKDKRVRLMIWGSPLTETNLIDMIENLEAHVVIDDFCVGSRHFWPEVEITEDPLDGLVMRYMEGIKCPRTFRETVGDFGEDMESRFGYLKAFAKEWSVDGVVLETVKYCDTHGYEVPGLKAYFEKMGIPVLYLEHEYTNMAEAQLKNRVEAFLEILE